MYVEFVNVYDEYKDIGLQMIGFPTNQFLELEPGSPAEIIAFARDTMQAKFPIMMKTDVNGPNAHAVFKHLRRNSPEFYNEKTGKIKNIPWNWAKFILDDQGNIIAYQHPRESLYHKIDLIEEKCGVRVMTTDQSDI